jgi:nicotinate dehydrogenase subunit B
VLAGWKLLFLDRTPVTRDNSKSVEWNHGAYLVEALAHCGACHTPRNIFFAEKRGSRFAGGETETWHAPALNADSPAPLPWTRADLLEYLRTGFNANHGVAAGPMSEVSRSLAKVPGTDVAAIATYIASLGARPDVPQAADATFVVATTTEQRQRRTLDAIEPPRKGGSLDGGAALYRSACARCHEPLDGAAASLAQPLALSTVLHAEKPDNLLHIILEGLDPKTTAAKIRMPPFRDHFDQYQVKMLAAYLRRTLTPLPVWTELDAAVHRHYPAVGAHLGK